MIFHFHGFHGSKVKGLVSPNYDGVLPLRNLLSIAVLFCFLCVSRGQGQSGCCRKLGRSLAPWKKPLFDPGWLLLHRFIAHRFVDSSIHRVVDSSMLVVGLSGWAGWLADWLAGRRIRLMSAGGMDWMYDVSWSSTLELGGARRIHMPNVCDVPRHTTAQKVNFQAELLTISLGGKWFMQTIPCSETKEPDKYKSDCRQLSNNRKGTTWSSTMVDAISWQWMEKHTPTLLVMGIDARNVDKAMYLGGTICKFAGRSSELSNRINKALVTCNELKTRWYKTNCTYKLQLQANDAIIAAQLAYRLCTVEMTPAMLRTLDAFRMRGFRWRSNTRNILEGLSKKSAIKSTSSWVKGPT